MKSDLSIGQVAKRLGFGRVHVLALVEAGKFPGAYRIPSAGRYGSAIRIPASAVEAAIKQWEVAPARRGTPVQRIPPERERRVALKHFPQFQGGDDRSNRAADGQLG